MKERTTMTVPLPNGMADELLQHMTNCQVCREAKLAGTYQYCGLGRKLIKLTIEERHGEINDER